MLNLCHIISDIVTRQHKHSKLFMYNLIAGCLTSSRKHFLFIFRNRTSSTISNKVHRNEGGVEQHLTEKYGELSRTKI
jgi:hypothetical protein